MNSLSKPLFENWENLPWPVYSKCVGFMNRDTRIALKLCSRNQKWLVEQCPTAKPGYFDADLKRLNETEFELSFGFAPKKWGVDHESKYVDSMEKINDIVQEKLEYYDKFDTVRISIDQNCPGFKLTQRPDSLQSREVHIAFRTSSCAVECLKQFDPNSLELLDLYDATYSDETPTELLNLKQVTTVKTLQTTSNVHDDHLMQYEAENLSLSQFGSISTTGLNKYIKKKLLKLNESELHFKIPFAWDRFDIETICDGLTVLFRDMFFLIDSPFYEYQLKLRRIDNVIEGERVLRKEMEANNDWCNDE